MNYKQPDPTFFLERSLGSDVVLQRLRTMGCRVEVHADHFADDELDHIWLDAIADRGWILLTKDGKIRSRPLEKIALERAYGVHVFFLGNRGLTGTQMANAFEAAMPRIRRLVSNATTRIKASVHRDGNITLLPAAEVRSSLPL